MELRSQKSHEYRKRLFPSSIVVRFIARYGLIISVYVASGVRHLTALLRPLQENCELGRNAKHTPDNYVVRITVEDASKLLDACGCEVDAPRSEGNEATEVASAPRHGIKEGMTSRGRFPQGSRGPTGMGAPLEEKPI